MPETKSTAPLIWQQHADATLSQDNPVSATLYTVFAAARNVRIISVNVSVTWTVQPTPLEIVLTIDGQTIIHAQTNPTSAGNYMIRRKGNAAESAQVFQTDDTEDSRKAFVYEGRTVKVEARTTGGTTSNLSARVKHAKIP